MTQQGILTELQKTFERSASEAVPVKHSNNAEMKDMLDSEFVLNKKLAR